MTDSEPRGEYCEPCDTWYHPKEEMKPFQMVHGGIVMMCMICYAHYDFKRRNPPAPSKRLSQWLKENPLQPPDDLL